MAITRYTRRTPFRSPWIELEDMGNRLNRLFVQPSSAEASHPSPWSPSVNVEESKDEILLTAELPGLSIEDVEIEVEDDVLSLQGEKKEEREETDEGRVHLRERRYGSFLRQFTLPRTVKADKISAHFKDGILNIQMPKAPEAKAKKIAIKAEG